MIFIPTRREGAYLIDIGVGGADTRGHGLVGMRNRVEAHDGRLRIDSPSGNGTRLHAEIPCG
jgi:signal transduction histidine kinase